MRARLHSTTLANSRWMLRKMDQLSWYRGRERRRSALPSFLKDGSAETKVAFIRTAKAAAKLSA